MDVNQFRKKFESKYQATPLIVRSPGRINLIGEHTDYNDGFVLPASIDKVILCAISGREDDEVHLHAENFNEDFVSSVNDLSIPGPLWPRYIIGVLAQIAKGGYKFGGINMMIGGNIPTGAGISSSAAIECSVAYAMNDFFDFGIQKIDLVKMAQKAEHEYVGVMCGIMDQFASMFGKEGELIKLDCRDLSYEYEPFHFPEIGILLLDTNVKHTLASGEYNVRRRQCEQGVKWVQEKYPAVKSLRDVTLQMLDEIVLPKDKLIYDRCSFVVEEISRVQEACKDLEANNLSAFGKKMKETHEGLSKKYEVSCEELDFIVDAIKDKQEVIGARMMGGGFGGCVIVLVKKDKLDTLVNEVSKKYMDKFGKETTPILVNIEEGTSKLT